MDLATLLKSFPGLENDPQLVELGEEVYVAKFFQYVGNTPAGGLANNNGVAAGSINIQIDSDADFQLLYLIGSHDALVGAGSLTVQIFEGGAGGLQWQNAAVNFDNLFGTAQLPFPIGLIPQLLPRKRNYVVVLLNTNGGAINAQFAFTGYKLYPAENISGVGALPTAAAA